MSKVALGLCGGVVLGWLSAAFAILVLLHDPFGQDAAPVIYPIERWRPGLALDDAKQQASREHLFLKQISSRGDYTVYQLGDRPAVSLGFCRGHLASARHSVPVNTALQALRYLDQIAGRPPEATASIQGFPDDSSPIWLLLVTWPTADGAVMTATLIADSGSVRLEVAHSAPKTECST